MCGSVLKSTIQNIAVHMCDYVVCVIIHTAYFNDVVVGAVCCRIETEGDQKKIYIMTLGVLAPYRQLGIGDMLLLGFFFRVMDFLYTM